MKKNNTYEFATKAIHAGGQADPLTGAVMPPIYQTSTFAQKSPGKHLGYEYSRTHNPTRSRLQEALAALENAKYALVTASGLSAMELILHHLGSGAKILCGDDVYGGTYRMLTTIFHKIHDIDFVDTTNSKNVEAAFKKKKYDLIWVETPTNPMLKISDIKKIATIASKHKCRVLVDNTFMSPYFQNPLDLGAHFVLHSMTKYINGHSDVVGGTILTNSKKDHDDLFRLQNSIGPCLSPFDSFLVLRGIKTLSIRMKAHEENAKKIAQFLEKESKVTKVIYPGLKSHPQHALAKSQMKGFGGMISFYIKGGLKESRKFLSELKLFTLAESLGGVESLIEHPAIMTHASVPKKIRAQLGIEDNFIRISCGIEDSQDLINDIKAALKKV